MRASLPPACSHPHPPGAVQPKNKGFAKTRGQCCETAAMHLPPRGSPAARRGPWPTDPEQLTAREGLQSQGHRPAVPSVRRDSRAWYGVAWEVGISAPLAHLPSYFSMLSQGVLPGTTNPAAPHEKTFYWPEVPSSRSAQHQSHRSISIYGYCLHSEFASPHPGKCLQNLSRHLLEFGKQRKTHKGSKSCL